MSDSESDYEAPEEVNLKDSKVKAKKQEDMVLDYKRSIQSMMKRKRKEKDVLFKKQAEVRRDAIQKSNSHNSPPTPSVPLEPTGTPLSENESATKKKKIPAMKPGRAEAAFDFKNRRLQHVADRDKLPVSRIQEIHQNKLKASGRALTS